MATFGKIGAKSLLEHRKFARDYIQDGLIALWDAEENVGWNKHEANPQTWKNLVGNSLDMISNGDPVFYSQYIQPTTLAQLWHTDTSDIFEPCVANGTFSMECAISYVVGQNGKFMLAYNDAALYLSTQCLDSTRIGVRATISGTTITSYRSNPTSGTASLSVISGNATARYYNSIALRTFGFPLFTTSRKQFSIGYRMANVNNNRLSGGEKIYCIRIYSRALSQEELAHNAAIDKARFHI